MSQGQRFLQPCPQPHPACKLPLASAPQGEEDQFEALAARVTEGFSWQEEQLLIPKQQEQIAFQQQSQMQQQQQEAQIAFQQMQQQKAGGVPTHTEKMKTTTAANAITNILGEVEKVAMLGSTFAASTNSAGTQMVDNVQVEILEKAIHDTLEGGPWDPDEKELRKKFAKDRRGNPTQGLVGLKEHLVEEIRKEAKDGKLKGFRFCLADNTEVDAADKRFAIKVGSGFNARKNKAIENYKDKHPPQPSPSPQISARIAPVPLSSKRPRTDDAIEVPEEEPFQYVSDDPRVEDKTVAQARKAVDKWRGDVLAEIRAIAESEETREAKAKAFKRLFDGGEVFQALGRLSVTIEALTQNAAAEGYARQWAEALIPTNNNKEELLAANQLDADRKVCLELIYELYNALRPSKNERPDPEELYDWFDKGRNIKDVLDNVLVFDRAKALYWNKTTLSNGDQVRGQHCWYAEESSLPEGLTGEDIPHQKGATINKRLFWYAYEYGPKKGGFTQENSGWLLELMKPMASESLIRAIQQRKAKQQEESAEAVIASTHDHAAMDVDKPNEV